MADTVRVANLWLAAFIQAGGASITGIEQRPDGKHVVVLDATTFQHQVVADALVETAHAVQAGPQDWESWFDSSFLDEVDYLYVKLKRRIFRKQGA